MEQQIGQTVQKMLDKPQDAWMATLPILFILGAIGLYFFGRQFQTNHQELIKDVMTKNDEREKRYIEREERYINIIDGSMKDFGGKIAELCDDVKDIKDEVADIIRGEK